MSDCKVKAPRLGSWQGLRLVCALILGCTLTDRAVATDIRLTNFLVHPHSAGFGEVEFDLAWDNSWRVTTEPHNWDAAWVFCKIRRNGGDWQHLKLSSTGHSIPSAPQLITTAPGLVDPSLPHNSSTNPVLGLFLYRTNDGAGTFTANDVRLRWSYADNGASAGDAIEIRPIAIEMVYAPQGAFYAGDNATSLSSLKQGSADNDAWYITSENAISVTNSSSNGYYYVADHILEGEDDDTTGATFTIPAAFPKGYAAFYMMKGEVSQSQWVAFFNTLTALQKTARDVTSNVPYGKNSDGLVYRNNVSWTSGDATLPDRGGGATYAGVAMNHLSWADLAAYLDWSGLRPMSELEFEKAARGPKTPVSGEYAWGSTVITRATSISNTGLWNERAQVGSNVAYGYAAGVEGPVRVGSFAQGVSSRQGSGSGFYGALDLSGNLTECSVTVGKATGRAFAGRYHGDGMLDTAGDANVSSWPDRLARGAGARGGAWDYEANQVRLSDRYAGGFGFADRSYNVGGRGVRSAPVIADAFLVAPPSPVSTERTLNSAVDGAGVVEWRYALGESGLNCGDAPPWSAWYNVSTQLSADLGFPGRKVLCLQGRDQANGITGPIRTYTWFLAYEYDIHLASITNVSSDTPVLAAVNDSSDPRSWFSDGCIDWRGNSSFTVDSSIRLLTICNGPGGWSACFASWDGQTETASWIDADPGTPGFQPHWTKCSYSSNGTTFLGNLFKHNLTATSDGRVFGTFNGTGGGCGPRLNNTGFYAITATSVANLASTSVDSGSHNWAQPVAAGTWREWYDRYGSWVNTDENDDIWVYNTSRDAASRPYFWGVEKSSNDYTGATSVPSQYLVADYQNGMVRRKGSTYHFIGYHTVRSRWEHVIGKSPNEFDWSHPTDLNLPAPLSVSGKWFSNNALNAANCAPGPYIHTFEVFTNSQNQTHLYIFYRAGDIFSASATTVRGIGAIRFALGNTIEP